MEKRAFGKTDMRVSLLGFGGAEIGLQNIPLAQVRELLTGALEAGLNVLDTAECYEGSEEFIGKAVGNRRSDYYLFTKCGHGLNYSMPAWGETDIARSIDRSLKRLQTDYVDLLQLHSCSEEILRKGEAIKALQRPNKLERPATSVIAATGAMPNMPSTQVFLMHCKRLAVSPTNKPLNRPFSLPCKRTWE